MLMFTLAIFYLTTSSLSWFMDLTFQVPIGHDWATELNWTDAILFFTALGFAFTPRHIHNWASFSLRLSIFSPSGATSLIFSRGILDSYQPEGFIFQCHVFLLFHTVHGVLKAWMLKRFSIPFSEPPGKPIPFSSGPHFVKTLHHDPSVLDFPTQHGS